MTNNVCRVCGKENCSFIKFFSQSAQQHTQNKAPAPAAKTQIVLVDLNPQVFLALKEAFKGQDDVVVKHASIIDQKTDAWVTPTNSKGNMSGGVDAAIKNSLGAFIEKDLKNQINGLFGGNFPIGRAINIRTNNVTNPKFVVATPTMVGESDDVSRTKNAALACAAVFQAIYSLRDLVGNVESIAIPGLGSGTGKMSPEKCAKLMLAGYLLFKDQRFASADEMEVALYALLEKMDVLAPSKPQPISPAEKAAIDTTLSQTKQTMYINASQLGLRLTPKQKLTLKALNDLTSPLGTTATARPVHVALRVKETSFVKSNLFHTDPSEWARDKLKRLVLQGLVTRVSHGRYGLTEVGRQVVQKI